MNAPESTIWTYPWDLIDEGPATAVARIQDVGLKGVSLASAYHSFEMLRPHQPGEVLLRAPRGAVYFRPERKLPLDALVSPWMDGRDWWAECAEAITDAGLDLVAWTVFLHSTEVALNHPDCAQTHATGDVSTSQLCPANPRVRDYAVAIAKNLSRYGITVMECESLGYGPAGHRHYHPKVGVDLGAGGQFLHSLCFCEACGSRAGDAGIDIDALRADVNDRLRGILSTGVGAADCELILSELRGLDRLIEMRQEVVASLVAEVKEASAATLSFIGMGDPLSTGAPFEALTDVADAFEILAYSSDVEAIKSRVGEAAKQAGDASRLTIGLQAYPPAAHSAEELASEVEAVRFCGVERLSFYNYGIMPFANLAWIRQALGA
ncbi:MAG: hypothetical protein CME26_04450 [Gemmatimonadetes bacterium]|nr:hypothetical protein [Gemmatimonadota bacterium]